MLKKSLDYRLYLVTDKGLLSGRDLCQCLEKAIKGGITLFQLREKELSTLEFYRESLKAKELADKYNIPLIINDRMDIALAVNADGLHIGQDDIPLSVARKFLGPEKIIGVSASTVEEALAAERNGADYLGVGAVFPTSTKGDADSVSLEQLIKIKSAVSIPVVAIGGINYTNANKVIAAGVDGIAVVSAILGKDDIKEAASELINLFS